MMHFFHTIFSTMDHWAYVLNEFYDIYPGYEHTFGEWFAILGPLVFGTLYYLYKFFYFVILRAQRDHLYDPRPMRVWYGAAMFNATILTLFGPVPVTVGVLLYVFILFLLEHDGFSVAV